MSTDLRELFEDAGRTPPTPRGWDPDEVVTRGRRLRVRRRLLAGTAGLALAGAGAVAAFALVGSGGAVLLPAATTTATAAPDAAPGSASPSTPATPSASAAACTSSDVTLSLGEGGGAAGTTYYPVLVKAVPGASCLLSGVPVVSVPMPEGSPLRAATSGTSSESVMVSGSTVASFAVGISATANYDPAVCRPVDVTSLEVVLPGDLQTTGATTTVELPARTPVCSGDVSALGRPVLVTPVVAGPDGS